jgi:sulfur relay (sulfurtransferase) DsrC/TusE family protein
LKEAKMLKRYQVLLADWQEDYVKFIADKYDLSFSEAIRGIICIEILFAAMHLYPEYKLETAIKKILKGLKGYPPRESFNDEQVHQTLSKIYFEARKAMEYRIGKEKK